MKRFSIIISLVFCLVLMTYSFAQDQQLDAYLKGDFDLTPDYEIGDKDLYKMRTVYLEMNDSGRVTKTRLLEGEFSREVIRFEGNRRYDRFVWKYVRIGERPGEGDISDKKELAYAREFDYEFAETDFTPGNFPVDSATIPKTIEGYLFWVKLIDAHSFDVIRTLHTNQSKRIGQQVEHPKMDLNGVIDFPPLITDSHFAQAPLFTQFQGIAVANGVTSMLLGFRSDDSQMNWVMNMMDMALPLDGTTYYWGDMLLSLENGKTLRGSLLERVDSIMAVPQLDKPVKNVVRRELTLEKLD